MGIFGDTNYRKINKRLRYIHISTSGITSGHCQVEQIWQCTEGNKKHRTETIVLIRKGTDGELYEFTGENETIEEALILADDYLHILSN